ncbi:beta-L-arabinofuranosidase domain-containing protein [Paenibacillus stellifer]|uniref:beta-L-arabinofuranosidase domain-containing protein n=1 Tax=Paenibacillus stellifer TaxID=169760 RepID=UPI00068CEF16|nr:beta-L-arabinofuranosidase domain-containing protein [Paenibacillus stellifer]
METTGNLARPLPHIPIRDFGLDRVILSDEYAVNAFARELDYLKNYDLDRLLSGFRETRGLTPRAPKYPGWEDTEIRGHTLGHYLTAISQAYKQTGDEELRERLEYLIGEFQLCQFENGYISAFDEALFDRIENRQPAWVPCYTMHKVLAGIVSVYEATSNASALEVASRLGDWVSARTSKWDDEIHSLVLSVEYGGMNDCLYDLYRITRSERHLEAAHMFDELTLFTPVHEGRDNLRGKHANTTIPKFLGALNRYNVLGESERFYLEACEKFWEMVVFHHSYMTGGNSEWEHFGEPDPLDRDRSNFTCETCNTYNMLKLTRELYVNQYISSRLDWEEAGIILIQQSELPAGDRTSFTLSVQDGVTSPLTLRFRIPSWAAGPIEADVNGHPEKLEAENGWAMLNKTWKDGDQIILRLPMTVTFSSLPDAPHVAGFRYGPFVLSAALGSDDMELSSTGVMVSVPTRSMLVKDFITVIGMSPEQWLADLPSHLMRDRDGKLAFTLKDTDEDSRLVFTPHYRQHRERYGIYWRIVEEDSLELQKHILNAKERGRTERATIDSLPVGNDQYELQHGVRGEATSVGTWDGSNFRRAESGGWFSYRMAVIPGRDNLLSVTYFAGNSGRTFEIYADDELIASEKLQAEDRRSFVEKHYVLSAGMIGDKTALDIKFAAREQDNAIFGILRTMTAFNSDTGIASLSFEGAEAEHLPDLAQREIVVNAAEDRAAITMMIAANHPGALVYVDGVLIDESQPRSVKLTGMETVVRLTVTAEDFTASRDYRIVIRK